MILYVSECCYVEVDEEARVCPHCGQKCQPIAIDEEEPEDYKPKRLTGAVRSAMRREANGDRYVND